MMLNKPFTFDRVIRIGISIAITWSLISLASYLSDVLIPFAIALLFAYLMNPLVVCVQQRLRVSNRLLAVLISLLLVVAACSLLGALLVPLMAAEVSRMKGLTEKIVNTDAIREQALSYIPPDLWTYVSGLLSTEELLQLLTFENVKAVGQQVLPGVWGVFSGTVSFLISLFGVVVILLYLIFILLDYEAVSEGWKELIPQQYKEPVLGVLSDFKEAMRNYFRAQALIAFLVGILFAVGFGAIRLPMGILLGLFIGLLNMVPYLQAIGLIPALAFALLSSLGTGGSVWIMIGLVLLVFGVVQVIQDMILVPKIMGQVTGFNPAVILLSLSVWGKLLGVLGLIIALPATFLLHSYYKRYLSLSRHAAQE